MKVPKKIWINPTTDLSKLSGHIDNNSVEYIRKDSLEVKEVDLEHLEQEVKDFCGRFDDRKGAWYNMTPHDQRIMVSPTFANFAMQIAKHFFELGLKAQKEELEYIKYQLELKLPETLNYNGIQVNREDFINDFIKAMKEK